MNNESTNIAETVLTTQQVANRFTELASQEKWFEIQDELFSDDVKSIEPVTAKYLRNAEGKSAVRKKGEDWVKRIEAARSRSTSAPVVAGNHFAIARSVDITVQGIGRIKVDEIIVYEVRNSQIVTEQFFY